LDEHEKRLPALQTAWENTVQRTPSWTILEPKEMKSAAGTILSKLPDNSILASGPNPSPEVYTVQVETKLLNITGFRLEVLADSSLPAKGPGRAPNGNFVLNELKVEFNKFDSKDKPTLAKLIRPSATFAQDTFPIGNAIDNNPATGWAIAPRFGQNQTAIFEIQEKPGSKEGTVFTFTLNQQFSGKDHNIGRFRLSFTTNKPPILLQGSAPENITKLLDITPEQRTAEQKTTLANHYRGIDQDLSKLQRSYNEFIVPPSPRSLGAQDLSWALMNSPAFLFNH
jgi:hypothetical protein